MEGVEIVMAKDDIEEAGERGTRPAKTLFKKKG